jgi:two-component system phosphate regulon sensor histidine kinase PhoR
MQFSRIKVPSLSVVLMISSLLLLMVLQFFWLRNSYDKAYADLRKDTNEVFRTTVIAMRDSSMLKNLKRMPVDSAFGKKKSFTFTQRIDCVEVQRSRGMATASEMKIIISGRDQSSDSVRAVVRPLVAQLHERKISGDHTFVLRMENDTLSTDTLLMKVRTAMANAGVDDDVSIGIVKKTDIPFEGRSVMIRRQAGGDSATARVIRSEWVPYDPFNRYAMSISEFRPMLFGEIAPQMLFSVFLTLLTATAFFIMYRSLRSQQRLMEMKNDFISNITHELKTPVTTVSVALEALRDFKGLENPKTTREYLDIAQSELNRLSILTDKILKSAVFENKGIGFDPEPVDLLKTVDQILRSMKLVFDKQKAHVSFAREGDSFTIMGGSVHLTNVIYNLLDNALKYSAGEPKISISLVEDANRVVLKIEDKGIGIPTEYRKKIFEKFFRVPTGDVHNVKGYGLGLSYVQAVIHSHRGLIEVNSTPGEGSIFTIFLPKQANAS